MSKVLENWDVASLYPNLVRIYGYSSRNQKDKKAYTDLLEMRIKAKKGLLTEDFLQPLNLTNDDLKGGLKLPLNAYTGTLRAPFNALYDNLQGFSICSTGQMLLLQLAHDLKQVPTVEITELNTDAVMYMIDEEYVEQAHKVLQDWQDLTGLELEQDKIKKLVMRDVNNYVEIIQTGDNDYDVHYKGGEFRGKHKFKWNKDKHCFEYTFKDDLENNSLTIVSEAIIKNLLFNIPVEETINNCNDIFRFQMISHLGHTYQKCVLKNKDGSEIELQRNNRVYAGLEKTGGKIYKVKEDGRYDSLANCPPNPIVDNKNELTIDKINKKWYINYTLQKISDFKGGNEVFMDEKLDKLKKDELIEMVKELKEKNEGTTLTSTTDYMSLYCNGDKPRLLQKINKFREEIRKRNFVLDKELPKNLGSGEIYSIDQIYQAVQETALNVGLDFSFEVIDLERLDLGAFKPVTGAPQNIATIRCRVTFTDIDTGEEKIYTMLSQGSDSIDKSVNGASSYAFRNWFNKNFTPCIINGEKIKFDEGASDFSVDAMESEEPKSTPKVPTFIPPEKKEEIVKELTESNSEQVVEEKTEDVDKLTNLIYEYRELSGNDEAGANKLEAIINKTYTDVDLLKWTLSFENAVNDLKKGK